MTPRVLIVSYTSLLGLTNKYQPRVSVGKLPLPSGSSTSDTQVPESNCNGDPRSPAALSDTRLSIFNLLPPRTVRATPLSALDFDDANLIWLVGDPATTIAKYIVFSSKFSGRSASSLIILIFSPV